MTFDFAAWLDLLSEPDYYPLSQVRSAFQEVQGIVEKCYEERVGNSLILMGNRSRGPITIVKEALRDALCKTVWLNGHLLSDSISVLKHLSWHFSTEHEDITFTSYEQFGSFLEEQYSERPLIFVLEELDLFAFLPGQHLLYTLFEAPTNLHLPILVVGLTERYDMVSMLEKRVKSRFSQHVIAASDTNVSFEGFKEALKAALCSEGMPSALKRKIVTVLDTKIVCDALNKAYLLSTSLRSVLVRLVPFLSTLQDGGSISASSFVTAIQSHHAPGLDSILTTATDAMLFLLIAIYRLGCKSHGQLRISFDALLAEAREMASQTEQNKVSAAFTISPETLKLAWDSLIDAGFISGKSAGSWVEQHVDACTVAEPLTNLLECLPESCPEHLRALARF